MKQGSKHAVIQAKSFAILFRCTGWTWWTIWAVHGIYGIKQSMFCLSDVVLFIQRKIWFFKYYMMITKITIFYEWPGSLRQIWAILSYFLWHILAVVLAPINKILIDQSKTNSEVQHLFPQTGSHLTDGTKFEFLFSSKPLFPYCDSCHWKI